MSVDKKIALVYFSRTAAAEGRAKAWFPQRPAAQQALATSLISRSAAVFQHTGFPVLHYHEGNQVGKTFGERIARASQETFSLGYDAIILVGNDSPEINQTDWSNVRQQLNRGRCVVGPSLRQGAYLIGLTREAFEQKRFQHLPWQTNRLLAALCEFCNAADRAPLLLAALRDVNSLHDLRKLVRHTGLNAAFKNIIRRLLHGLPKAAPSLLVHRIATAVLLDSTPFRGPPLSLLPSL